MNNNVFIIAEAGVNHNGDISIAKKLIRAAKKSGADAVKFQSFKAADLVVKTSPKAEYQKKYTDAEETQLEMLKKLELSCEEFLELKSYCEIEGIIFLSSPFDIESAIFLNKLGQSIFKIPSGEITNLPYLRVVSDLAEQVILSTGMSTLEDIEKALEVFFQAGLTREQITLLHCTSEYPAPYDEINLNSMSTLKGKFKTSIGYSDHSRGIEVSVAAVALGAKVIEKHFTLDKNMKGPDHVASLDPVELKELVTSIRNVFSCLGSFEKGPSQSELQTMKVVRKSIVASSKITKGDLLDSSNLTCKRPGTGISPMEWDHVIGQKASRDFFEDELIIV